MLWPNQPEYLQLFSNAGPVSVNVKFTDQSDEHRSMPEMSMHWNELDNLIDRNTGSHYPFIYFDTHRCTIERYEIDPAQNCLSIILAKTDLP